MGFRWKTVRFEQELWFTVDAAAPGEWIIMVENRGAIFTNFSPVELSITAPAEYRISGANLSALGNPAQLNPGESFAMGLSISLDGYDWATDPKQDPLGCPRLAIELSYVHQRPGYDITARTVNLELSNWIDGFND